MRISDWSSDVCSSDLGRTRPFWAWLKASCCARRSCCSADRRSSFTPSGTCSADAAGVPGRGLYLKEKAWAYPTAVTSPMVAAKSWSRSPGNPTLKSDRKSVGEGKGVDEGEERGGS